MSGSRNTLIGYGATLPDPASSGQIVIGSAADTVYIGGASGLVVNQATGVQLPTAGPLIVNLSAGSTGLPLVSGGATNPPQWQPPPVTVTSSPYTISSSPVAGLYVVNRSSLTTFNLPALNADSSFIGNCLIIKAITAATINGSITQGNSTLSTISMSAGDVAEFISDATTWYIVSQNRSFS